MVAGSLLQFALGALAPVLLDELSIQRSQLGLLQSVLFLIAGVASPGAGHLADTRGARFVFAGTFASGAAALVLLAAAQTYVWCIAAAICGGIAAAGANPATNKAIATQIPVRRQGPVVGIKQSGVQLSAVVVGVLVPFIVSFSNWRIAALTLAAVPGVMLAVAWRVLRPATATIALTPTGRRGTGLRSIKVLTLYAVFMGMGTASFSLYIPLFGYEVLQLSLSATGLAVALTGGIGVAARVLVPQMFGDATDFGMMLGGLGVVGSCAVLLFLAAGTAGVAFFWAAVVLCGLATSWNAVTMLAVMRRAGQDIAGLAAGTVQRGFFLGVMVTPPVLGLLVDRIGGYTSVWLIVAAVFFIGGLIAFAARGALVPLPPSPVGAVT